MSESKYPLVRCIQKMIRPVEAKIAFGGGAGFIVFVGLGIGLGHRSVVGFFLLWIGLLLVPSAILVLIGLSIKNRSAKSLAYVLVFPLVVSMCILTRIDTWASPVRFLINKSSYDEQARQLSAGEEPDCLTKKSCHPGVEGSYDLWWYLWNVDDEVGFAVIHDPTGSASDPNFSSESVSDCDSMYDDYYVCSMYQG